MNTVFFGSASFSIPILETLLKMGYQVTVVTEPDKPAGRGQKLTSNPVKKFALEYNLKILEDFHQLKNIVRACREPNLMGIQNQAEYRKILKQVQDDALAPFGVLAAYGKILPKELLSQLPKGILNFHPSLLPKYRGATPIQSAILVGEKETGMTMIKLAEKVDAGEIVAQESVSIDNTDTTASLTNKLAALAAQMLKKNLPLYLKNKLKLKKQNEKLISKTSKITKDESRINWQEDPKIIDRKIRAFNPWPKAFVEIAGQRVIFLESRYDAENNKLEVFKLQVAGKKPISGKEFLRGYQYLLTAFPKFVTFK